MSFLQYGPVTIGLNGLLATDRYEKFPEIEAVNYTQRRHVLKVRGYLNPQSISAQPVLNNQGQIDPTQLTTSPGTAPPVTEVAFRFMLEQPRQSLIYVSGNTIILVSPSPGTPCDAAGGPIPKVVRMIPVLGEYKTWLVDFEVETYINDCPPFPPGSLFTFGALASRAITSNIWTMGHTTDVHGLTVRETEGRTTFRMDILAAGGFPGVLPDQLRPFFLPPVIPNARREVTFARQTETNNALQWKIRDVELMNNVVAQGVTRVSLRHRARIVSLDQTETIAKAAEDALDFAGQALSHIARTAGQLGTVIELGTPAGADALGWAFRGAASVARRARGIIPTVEIMVSVTVWGRRDCATKTLERFALQLANARLTFSLSFGARVMAGQTIDLEEDCSEERRVTLNATMRSSMSGLFYLLPGQAAGILDIGRFFPDADGTPVGGQNGIIATTLPGLSLVNDNGTRGSFIGMVQAPNVTGPCVPVSVPGAPAPANTSPVIGPDPTTITATPTTVAPPPSSVATVQRLVNPTGP